MLLRLLLHVWFTPSAECADIDATCIPVSYPINFICIGEKKTFFTHFRRSLANAQLMIASTAYKLYGWMNCIHTCHGTTNSHVRSHNGANVTRSKPSEIDAKQRQKKIQRRSNKRNIIRTILTQGLCPCDHIFKLLDTIIWHGTRPSGPGVNTTALKVL